MTTIGQILDAQGMQVQLENGDLVDGAVLVSRIRRANGTTSTSVAYTDGMDFITRRGLLEIARDGERIPARHSSGWEGGDDE